MPQARPPDRAEEARLIQRAQAGEAAALEALYDQYAPAIFRYFYFRVRDPLLAEDLTGIVFLKMVEHLPRYIERGAPLGAWLFQIAHSQFIDHVRRSARHPQDALSEATPADDADPETQVEFVFENQQLWVALQTLTAEQQQVVQLRFWEGYSLEATAQLLGKTIGAVKALQHRALRHLTLQIKS